MKVVQSYISKSLLIMLLLGIIIKLILIFYSSAFSIVLLGSEQDSLSYNNIAKSFATDGIFERIASDRFYPYVLGVLYYLISPNYLIGKIFTIIIWSISFIVFINCLKKMNINSRIIIFSSFIYMFLPSSIYFNSFTFREPFQLLLINLFCYLILMLDFKKINFKHIYISLLIFFVLIYASYYFHSILPVLFTLSLIICVINLIYFSYFSSIFLYFFIVLIFFLFLSFMNFDDSIFAQIKNFRDNASFFNARTYYEIKINFSETGLLNYYYLLKIFLLYFLKPFWYELKYAMDYIVYLDTILRIFILLFCLLTLLIGILKKNVNLNIKFLNVITIFIFLELFWAIGSTAWGTAIRHHSTANGLLLLIFSFCVNYAFKDRKLLYKLNI